MQLLAQWIYEINVIHRINEAGIARSQPSARLRCPRDGASVTRAAAKVGLSQPALSNALARLRALFRDPLFERSAGQMQPTPRARQLLIPLSEAISKLREAFETQAAFRPDASDREFLIATNDYVDSLLLPRVVQRLQRDAPSIALRTVRTDYLFLPRSSVCNRANSIWPSAFSAKRRGRIPDC